MTRLSMDRKKTKDNAGRLEDSSIMQQRAQEKARIDGAPPSGGEGATSKKLQKHAPNTTPVARPSEPTPLAGLRTDPTAATAASRRRQSSLRHQKLSIAPSTMQASPSKRSTREQPKQQITAQSQPYGSYGYPTSHTRQTSVNSDGREGIASTAHPPQRSPTPPSGSFDFLSAVNFDDLQTSLLSEVADIDSFPAPGGSTFKQLDGSKEIPTTVQRMPVRNMSTRNEGSEGGTRIGLNGASIRRHNSGTKVTQTSCDSEPVDSSTGSMQKGNRRKSYFPSTTTASASPRSPRKSVGPGILTTGLDAERPDPRRPGLVQAGFGGSSDAVMASKGPLVGSQSANFETVRYHKAKSFQAVPRRSHEAPRTPSGFAGPMDVFTTAHTQSPARPNLRTITPSSSKRLSIMPNSAHATGLAARTISPTDARRMKRMSMMPNPPPMPYTPPTPQPDTPSSAGLPSAPSPSFIPRKSVTPSSSRTTPDPNRKSYSSGFSISSSTSYNSNTGPNGAARMSQNVGTSRLPTLKARTDNMSGGDDEIVPPVPAIPKAYESPKEEVPHPFFSNRKASLASDGNSSKTPSISGGGPTPREETSSKVVHDSTKPQNNYKHLEPATERKPSNSDMNRRTLQPLRLPPLNLLPLSAPTATKIAALYDGSVAKDEGTVTPPPKKGTKAAPTTPMTASKASFPKAYYDSDDNAKPYQLRSSSSHHITRPDNNRAPSSSSTTVPNPPESYAANSSRTAMSPFVSSSLPKSSGEFNLLRREGSNPVDTSGDEKRGRLTGPRSHKPQKLAKDDGSGLDTNGSVEPSSSSFGSSLRRKLSLTRRRSGSKAQTASDRDNEIPPKPPKHDDMPPPRLPASATWNGPMMPSPSPSQKALRSRNTSNSSTIVQHERNRSSTWDSAETPKKAPKSSTSAAAPVAKRTTRSVLEGASQQDGSSLKDFLREAKLIEMQLDRDDQAAEEEMKRLASRRKETENAAKELDALTRRATAKDRVSPTSALRMVKLNIFERGEIVDYKDIYFCGTHNAKKHIGDLSEAASNFGYDDDRGDYNIITGDHIAYRYEIVDILGKGSFGQVVRCVDHKTGGLVAIKIIRNKKRFHQQALVEVDILQKLREWDPHNRHSMVNFTQSFYFRGHLCISTELLGMNLYEFIKCHDFRGFSLKLIRRFAKQLLSSLVLLKSKKVIHCDLKPENVLLAHPARSEIKVIDFGSSCLENEKVYTYIQSRFYRSPEVILGMTYGMPIDMWSLGCILAELLTGYPIFPGENEQEQLACIMEVFGPPEKHLIEKSTRKKLFFDSLGKPRITVSAKGKRRRASSKTLQQALKCEDEAFLDFITRCLRWDPDRRLKPDEAIAHEFISGRSIKGPTRPRTAPSNASSPIKRYNSICQTPASVRPLPEPPATLKTVPTPKLRDTASATVNTSSPIKQTSSAPRRNSTVNGLQMNAPNAGLGVPTKRTVNGAVMSSSSLPRVTSNQRGGSAIATGNGRGVGAVDLAAAAAAASLATKSR